MKDLSGDGKVTKKDVLIGRGVIEKKNGGMLNGYMGGGMIKKATSTVARSKVTMQAAA